MEATIDGEAEALDFDVEDGALATPGDSSAFYDDIALTDAGLVAKVRVGMDHEPDTVQVTLNLNDEELVSGEVAPDWGEENYINGPKRCGYCVSGTATLE